MHCVKLVFDSSLPDVDDTRGYQKHLQHPLLVPAEWCDQDPIAVSNGKSRFQIPFADVRNLNTEFLSLIGDFCPECFDIQNPGKANVQIKPDASLSVYDARCPSNLGSVSHSRNLRLSCPIAGGSQSGHEWSCPRIRNRSRRQAEHRDFRGIQDVAARMLLQPMDDLRCFVRRQDSHVRWFRSQLPDFIRGFRRDGQVYPAERGRADDLPSSPGQNVAQFQIGGNEPSLCDDLLLSKFGPMAQQLLNALMLRLVGTNK